MNKIFEPFGDEWYKELMKLSKKELVDKYKKVCIDKMKLSKFLEDFTLLPEATLTELKGWQEEAAKIIKEIRE